MNKDRITGYVAVWVPDLTGQYWQVLLPIGYAKETLRETLSAVSNKARQSNYLPQPPAIHKPAERTRRSVPVSAPMPQAQAIPTKAEPVELCPIHGVVLKKSGYSPPKGALAAYYCPAEDGTGLKCNIRLYVNRDGSTNLVQIE